VVQRRPGTGPWCGRMWATGSPTILGGGVRKAGRFPQVIGAVAQLVERVLGRHEVMGSNPISSTRGQRPDWASSLDRPCHKSGPCGTFSVERSFPRTRGLASGSPGRDSRAGSQPLPSSSPCRSELRGHDSRPRDWAGRTYSQRKGPRTLLIPSTSRSPLGFLGRRIPQLGGPFPANMGCWRGHDTRQHLDRFSAQPHLGHHALELGNGLVMGQLRVAIAHVEGGFDQPVVRLPSGPFAVVTEHSEELKEGRRRDFPHDPRNDPGYSIHTYGFGSFGGWPKQQNAPSAGEWPRALTFAKEPRGGVRFLRCGTASRPTNHG
jgi:hypothetical protein